MDGPPRLRGGDDTHGLVRLRRLTLTPARARASDLALTLILILTITLTRYFYDGYIDFAGMLAYEKYTQLILDGS